MRNGKILWLVALVAIGSIILVGSSQLYSKKKDRTDIKIRTEKMDKPEIHVGLGHSSGMKIVNYSPDGKYILSSSYDGNIILWDVVTGKELRTFSGLYCIYSPDGKTFLTNSGNNTVTLFDVATGAELKKITMENFGSSCFFLPNGKQIIYRSSEDTIKILDIETNKELRSFQIKSLDTIGESFTDISPDGKYFLVMWGNNVSLYDIITGEKIRTFTGHSEKINCFDFSPDGKCLITGSDDKTLKLWDLSTGKELQTLGGLFTGHSHWVVSVEYSPDGRYILSGSVDKNIILWDAATGEEVRTFKGHNSEVKTLSFSPDGKNFISGSWDDELKLWDVYTGNELRNYDRFTHYVGKVVFSADRTRAIIMSNIETDDEVSRIFYLWDMISGKQIRSFQLETGSISYCWFSPDFKYAIIDSKDCVYLWDVESGIKLRRFKVESCFNVIFSTDCRYILSCSGNDATLLDINTGDELGSLKCSQNDIAYSPDKKFAYQYSKYGCKFWEVDSGKQIRDFSNPSGVMHVVVSQNGKYILSWNENNNITKFLYQNLQLGEEINTFTLKNDIDEISISPDGLYALMSLESDDKIIYFDLQTGKELTTLNGHKGDITSLNFMSAGEYAISTSDDGTTRVWNLKTGQWVVFMNHSNGKDWLIFDSDGYWDSSRCGGDLVAMVRGMDCWNIDQFAIKNNRPDLILAKLPNADKNLISEYNKQYRKRIAKLEKLYGIKETDLSSDMHVPKAEILKADQAGKKIKLSIKLSDSQYDIVSYNIYVNDVPVYTEIGKKIKRDDELTVTETIELSAGENKIEVSCFNEKGAESYRTLTYASFEEKRKGNLYFIGFGVSDYSDPSISDLRYAENDVLDLAKKFSGMKGDYDNVYVKTYTGKEVTPGNIKAAKDFVKNAGVDDTVILFISGHGMHDSDEYRTYYYLTQNTDMKNLKDTAANFETVEDILAGISPRKKLFLMDTCDSGELDDFAVKKKAIVDKNSKGTPRTPKGIVIETTENRGYFDRGRYIYNDLFRRTGAVVFSSSMGGEASWEFDSLKNGAFTEAILEGLSGKADADKNGTVTIDELNEYVGGSVKGYTENRQHPVIDRDNIYVKFELPVR